MTFFSEYSTQTKNQKHFKTIFELENTPLYIANSLRRSFSSLVPTTSFDDTYFDKKEDRSIQINTNTSALHNEFLSHRLSLIPINLENKDNLKIKTFLDKNDIRKFDFNNPETIPIFNMKIKNNIDQISKRDKDGLIDVTTHHFVNTDSEYTIGEYFPLDVFTQEPILINRLKFNITNNDDGDELDITCIPRIGQGKQNSRYDPTGTVTFQFKTESADIVDSVFKKKLEYLNNERVSKGLPKFTEEEETQQQKTFNLLDKDRVFKKNENGNPDIFQFSVESIGFLNPDQIIYDGITMLYLLIKDISNNINISSNKEILSYNTKGNVSITNLQNTNNLGININVNNENHTIGNLVNSIIRDYYCGQKAFEANLLSIASYKMEHPTIENIDFMIVPNTEISKELYITYIKNIISKDASFKYSYINPEWDIHDIRNLFCTLLFIKSLNIAMYKLQLLLNEFSTISKITEPNFIVTNKLDYYTKNKKLVGNVINNSDNDYKEYYEKLNISPFFKTENLIS